MVPRLLPFSALIGAMAMLLPVSACVSPVQHARVLQEKNDLLRDKRRIQRTIAQRDGTIAQLERQIENLKGFAPDRPADLFAPVKLDIGSLSGGADYDGMEPDPPPEGLEDVSKYPALLAELSRRGWSEDDLAKLAGRNILRAWGEAENASARIQEQRGPSNATIEELDEGSRPQN